MGATSEISTGRRSRSDLYPASTMAIVCRLSAPLVGGSEFVAAAFIISDMGPRNASGNQTSFQRGVNQTPGWAVVVKVIVLGARFG